jgi:probable H4MPT-linked C1 transfer pathway protein
MAVSQNVFFQGAAVGLMAEYFATMADVYRLTGDLNEAYDQTESADGMEKTVQASARRLARMIGYEFNEADLSLWQQLAMQLKYQQKQQIQQACLRQLSRNTKVKPCWVGAGIGKFLVKHIAFDLGHPYQDFSDFFTPVDSVMSVADCAPAVAVAYLSKKLAASDISVR